MSAHTTEDLTRRLVAHVRGQSSREVPSEVDLTTRLCVLDWLAVVVAGADEPLTNILREEALAQQSAGRSILVGRDDRMSPHLAAMVNAAAADALDFSDGNLAMRGHTTPAVIATAFALAQHTGANASSLMKAIVAGVELECRIGLILNPPRLRKGFHPTGNIATFGATAAAAMLLELSDDQWCYAIGLAATQTAGLFASGGTMAKPFHSGKAALNGILSASLAKRGFVSNPLALEAPEGFLATHSAGEIPSEVLAMDDRYLIMGTIFKTHAACQLTHSSIENMRLLVSEHGVAPESIDHVELQVPRGYLSVCNIPMPDTALETKFSLRGVAAMTLLGDDTREIDSYRPERIRRTEIRQLIKRIDVKPRDDIGGGTSVAVVTTTDGKQIHLTSDTYKPIADMAVKEGAVLRKFRSLVSPKLGEDGATALQRAVLGMSSADAVESILELVAGVGHT